MQVKNAVVSYLQEELDGQNGLRETKEFVREHLEEIREVAQQTVRQEQ